MRRRDVMGLMGSMLALAGCWGDQSWHQKLTVTVNTPSGPVSGSSVTEVTLHENTIFKDGARFQYSIEGEAVVVDLGGGKYIFALLSNADRVELVSMLGPELANRLKLNPTRDNALGEIREKRQPTKLPSDLYPLLVTFGDINDPKSVKEVKPERLAEHFGAGFSLSSITLEITEIKVADGSVERALGSDFFGHWGAIHNEALKTQTLSGPYFLTLASKLSRSDFIQGD